MCPLVARKELANSLKLAAVWRIEPVHARHLNGAADALQAPAPEQGVSSQPYKGLPPSTSAVGGQTSIQPLLGLIPIISSIADCFFHDDQNDPKTPCFLASNSS